MKQTFTPFNKLTIFSILVFPLLVGCSAISNPIAFYQCETSEATINQKLDKMNAAYNKLVALVNNNPTITDKAQYTFYNKMLVESVKLKIQNDKYHEESGDYSYCSQSAKDTISYIEGITAFLNTTTNTINTVTSQVGDIEKSLDCSSREDCASKVDATVINKINKQINQLVINPLP